MSIGAMMSESEVREGRTVGRPDVNKHFLCEKTTGDHVTTMRREVTLIEPEGREGITREAD
jgi:hypothetical protein